MPVSRIQQTPARAARTAALLLWICLAGASCTERTVVSEHYALGPPPAEGNKRTVILDESGKRAPKAEATIKPIVRLRFDGRTLPVPAPDGRRIAVQTASNASWAVEIGDPLPAEGVSATIEALTLDGDAPGAPLSKLEGPWLLGRAATDEGFLVERPREDGARDIALSRWQGGLRMIVADEWTNAFATAAPDGSLAWSRRPAEGGDWQLVVQRAGNRRVLKGRPGEQWLLPVFAGDGTGIFALRLDRPSLVAAWIPFGADGLPSPEALENTEMVVLLSLRANLSHAVQAMTPVGGLSASPPGRERLAIYVPDSGRMALWAPGGRLELLAQRSVAATLIDAGNAVVTLPESVARQQLGPNELPTTMLAEGAWVTRPTTLSATQLIALRALNGQIEIAQFTLDPEGQSRTTVE